MTMWNMYNQLDQYDHKKKLRVNGRPITNHYYSIDGVNLIISLDDQYDKLDTVQEVLLYLEYIQEVEDRQGEVHKVVAGKGLRFGYDENDNVEEVALKIEETETEVNIITFPVKVSKGEDIMLDIGSKIQVNKVGDTNHGIKGYVVDMVKAFNTAFYILDFDKSTIYSADELLVMM